MTRLPKLSEDQFLRQVLELAKHCGWRSLHIRPGRTIDGSYRTPVQGDGKGFPDVLLAKGKTLLVAELKVGSNKPTAEQEAWLAAFRDAGIPAFVWTPADWGLIEKVLMEGR